MSPSPRRVQPWRSWTTATPTPIPTSSTPQHDLPPRRSPSRPTSSSATQTPSWRAGVIPRLAVFFEPETVVFFVVVDALLAFVTDADFLAVDVFSVEATARLDAGAALLTVRFASFLASGLASDCFGTEVPALLDEVFALAPDFGAAAGRAAGAFLTEVPLLADVIVPPSRATWSDRSPRQPWRGSG